MLLANKWNCSLQRSFWSPKKLWDKNRLQLQVNRNFVSPYTAQHWGSKQPRAKQRFVQLYWPWLHAKKSALVISARQSHCMLLRMHLHLQMQDELVARLSAWHAYLQSLQLPARVTIGRSVACIHPWGWQTWFARDTSPQGPDYHGNSRNQEVLSVSLISDNHVSAFCLTVRWYAFIILDFNARGSDRA